MVSTHRLAYLCCQRDASLDVKFGYSEAPLLHPQFLTLVSDYSLKIIHEVKKGYPTFQTKVFDPYPQLNGGQHLGAVEACPKAFCYM